ncbi:McrC family protein [Actinomadura parmotrematis]|uniref:McrC family protein n=1 Tax=Actinomadura parmotrematis TaxID=2864039 RepID=A0ABS7FWI4_9ACTN|nr:McrC family protein [Actinomadura parmotrematis]MBW8483942.1 McrC family protein [Actinomadura parmotrematis]
MTTVELAEHGGPVSVPLPDALGRAVGLSKIVDAVPDPFHAGRWRLQEKWGKVGVCTIAAPDGTAVTLRIVPKLPVARVLFLLGYQQSPKGWRDDEVTAAEEAELLPVLARLFERQAERALRQGLMQGYHVVEESGPVVRGRIREADQLRRHHGRLVPVETVHDEYSTDIAENRLLLAACERLCRLPQGVPGDVRRGLLRLRSRLADVSPLVRGRPLPGWRPTRLNARYHHALRLADLVLRGASVDHLPGGVTVSGFLFSMPRVFEDFLTVALREALAGRAVRCAFQDAMALDENGDITMRPDLVVYSGARSPLAVADAKYKVNKTDKALNADVYQMLAYCTRLGLADGHLVYAAGEVEAAVHRVMGTPVRVHRHALDLGRSPDELLADVRVLASLLVPS